MRELRIQCVIAVYKNGFCIDIICELYFTKQTLEYTVICNLFL
jgi:hypothetical protein